MAVVSLLGGIVVNRNLVSPWRAKVVADGRGRSSPMLGMP